MPTKSAKAIAMKRLIQIDRVAEERHGRDWHLEGVQKWVEEIYCGPDFKPDLRVTTTRRARARRQASLRAEEQIHQFTCHGMSRKTRGLEQSGEQKPLHETLYWCPVEHGNAALTEAFIKATSIPFENRTHGQDEDIALYWRRGLSLDVVLQFENGEATLAELESVSRQAQLEGKCSGVSQQHRPRDVLPKRTVPTPPTSKQRGRGDVRSRSA